jgi:hypothetical protein
MVTAQAGNAGPDLQSGIAAATADGLAIYRVECERGLKWKRHLKEKRS